MQLTLRPDIEEFVHQQIQSGRYASANDLVMEALQWMMIDEVRQSDLDADTAAALDRADEQYQRGEGIAFDTFAAEWRKRIGRSKR